MTDPSLPLLHVGFDLELTFLEYLYRVLLHLVAIGGVALVALRLSDALRAIRAAVSPPRESEGRGE